MSVELISVLFFTNIPEALIREMPCDYPIEWGRMSQFSQT